MDGKLGQEDEREDGYRPGWFLSKRHLIISPYIETTVNVDPNLNRVKIEKRRRGNLWFLETKDNDHLIDRVMKMPIFMRVLLEVYNIIYYFTC